MEEEKNSLIEEYKEFLVSDVYFSDEEKKKGILSVPSHKEVADWWLKKLDLAVSKERERIVGEVKKRSSFFKIIVSEWGDIYIDIVKGITEDDIINLINTK